MTVIFSKKCELGLQACLYLATKDRTEVASAYEIAEHLKVPKEFVSKVLQSLTFAGIISSRKGKNGGFKLAEDPHGIKLIDIVLALDGEEIFNRCILGFPGCSAQNPCPIHNKWEKIRIKTRRILSESDLNQLKKLTIQKLKKI